MFAPRAVVPIALIAAAGCSSYYHDVLMIDPTPRDPTIVDSVRVLAQEPSQTYKVVALISVQTNVGDPTLRYMAYELMLGAASLGANGLLIGPESITERQDEWVMTGRAVVFDSIAPPATRLDKPAQRMVLRTVAAVTLLTASVVAAVVAAKSGDEIPTTPTLP